MSIEGLGVLQTDISARSGDLVKLEGPASGRA